jgi:hypothetical protein
MATLPSSTATDGVSGIWLAVPAQTEDAATVGNERRRIATSLASSKGSVVAGSRPGSSPRVALLHLRNAVFQSTYSGWNSNDTKDVIDASTSATGIGSFTHSQMIFASSS